MRPAEQERLRSFGARPRRTSPRPPRRALRGLPSALCGKHDAHRAADSRGLGTSRRHPLARSDATRDRPHERRDHRQDAPRLRRRRGRYRRRCAEDCRRRRDHFPARNPRQPRPLRRKPRSPARRPTLPRLRPKIPRQHVSYFRRPARQIRQAAETRRTASPRRPFAVSRRNAIRRHPRDPAPRRHSTGIPHLAPLDRRRHRRGQDHRLAVFHRQGSGARRARRMLARHPRQPAPIGRGPLGIETLRSRPAPRRQALHPRRRRHRVPDRSQSLRHAPRPARDPLAARPRAADQQRHRNVRLHHRLALAGRNDKPAIDALPLRHPRAVRDSRGDDPHLP